MNQFWEKHQGRLTLVFFAISGMTALIYEIVWIRPLSLVFGTTIYAVSIIVASFLFGLAVGSWIIGRFADRIEIPIKFYAFMELGIGLYGILLIPLFSVLPSTYLNLYQATFPYFSVFSFLEFLLAFLIIMIPTTLMGTTLPLVIKSYSNKHEKIGNDLGKLYSVNNLGAVAGTLLAGFVLIPVLGIKSGIILTALINISLAMFIIGIIKKSYVKYLVVIIVIILVIGVYSTYDFGLLNFGMYFYAFPDLKMNDVYDLQKIEHLKLYKESLYSSIAVTSFNDTGVDVLTINGKTQCSTNSTSITGMQKIGSIAYHTFNYNYGKPDNALNIGLGCGDTSKWLSNNVNTTTIEIDPAIVEASMLLHGKINQKLIVDDARNWMIRSNEKFDLITTQPSDPFSNQGYLFTREYFLLLDNRLTPNGIASMWVPTYLMNLEDFNIFYNTFHSVFPNVYVFQQGTNLDELIFLGSNKEINIASDLSYLTSNKDISIPKTVLNTDDKPTIEFSAAVNLYKPDTTAIFEEMESWKKQP